MTGKQLDCCTLAEAKREEADVSLAEDGAMAPAAQGDAAKHDLGDEADVEIGEYCTPAECNQLVN